MISVFLRWAKAPRTTRKKRAGSPTGTGGASRTVMRITEEVTLGAGRKQEGGTSKRTSQWA